MSEIPKFDLGTEENLVKGAETVPLCKNEENGQRRSDGVFLLFCVFIVNLFMFLTGCGLSWTSPVLLKLYSNDTSINPLGKPVTKLQESLIAGIPFLGSLIGPLLSSKLTDIYGRKRVLVIFGGVQLLFFLLLTAGTTIWIYYVSRFLFGLGFGVSVPVTTIYITEISPKHNRGRYGSILGMFVPLGNLCSYVFGPMLSVPMFSFICALPCLIGFPFFVLLVPDSPTSLVTKGKVQKAAMVLKKLRNSEEVTKELEEALYIAKKHEHSGIKANFKNLLNDNVSLQGLKIGFGIMFFQTFTGMVVIMAFVGPIFDNINAGISGNAIAILVGIVKFLTFTFTATVIDKFKRKTLLMFSTINTSLCLAILGAYFYLKDSKFAKIFINIDQFSWVPVTCILLFIVFYAIGIGPISLILLGEIFPGRFKAIAVPFVTLGFTLLSFVTSFSFPFITYYFGTYVVFWIFSLSCFLGTFFVYFKVPETKGKSLLEIQHMLDKLHA